ncbi:sulfite oxidase isoform X1 [Selaginella moellendorffii]|uniref:sulfite oxidase isoform X1 n=2 Tax=Selaginella moellendorffii TaxID=88036 RepID=UPI000D1CD1C7|nr:sulfite oxidase isoform X1 [Selaginella moellendorffii]XP_024536234.1 sulfite oxidase isoform X1 [Selaginella moellendorffii]|eukprot:XP_024536233.1 sulfite oxidase isoform X1 [Selaginella moellendorffii]
MDLQVCAMGVLYGPKSYENEPHRDPSLIVNSKEPFNAETPPKALVRSFVTPEDLFYKRNHGPIPVIDDPNNYRLEIGGLVPGPLSLSLQDLRNLPKHTVTATLQCAGNRRTAMSKVRKVKGVGWAISALGNAVWGGARLHDVLELAGVRQESSKRHVEFSSVDVCKEENGGPYKASIPLSQAMSPEAEVILAYEMNGKELNRDHGFPLRVVVPGVIGARSVKWLTEIKVIEEECQGFFMQKDYKMFPPTVDWDNINWNSRRPLMDFPVQCAICSPAEGDLVKAGSKMKIQGYAVSGGGRGIERVDVSVDGGKTWQEAQRFQDDKEYIADNPEKCKRFAWVLWELTVELTNSPLEVVAKAVDAAANIQPEDVSSIWNLRGVLNTSWHRVKLNVVPPQSKL